ncbi:MAG: iron-sulfur cluster repair di-iron protein [Pirellulaceae bacterium]
MATQQLEMTHVGKIVAEQPGVARIFEKHKIDYCCQGATTLIDACKRKKVDLTQVMDEIRQVVSLQNKHDETDWTAAPLAELVRNIVDTHHNFLRTELPRISALVAKVNKVHGENHSELAEVASTFEAMRAELESHMLKEERVLFPAIDMMEVRQIAGSFPFGSVANPIDMMELEHDEVGAALRKLRELTGDFTPSPEACTTWRVMLEALENLEQDIHQHIHKENNILFPRAIELEAAVR